MTEAEISKLFEDIELKLTASLKRNLTHHKKEEKATGFEWAAWQADKIKNLERYRKENILIVKEYRNIIDRETRKMLSEQFAEGEALAAENLKDLGLFPTVSDDNFFDIYEEKIESLIEEVQGKERTAQNAALRMMDDVYRQTVLKADTALQTGSVSLQQAIEQAVNDFAEKGINCIEYRDGRRVNIVEYVQMALRTSNTRAALMGGAKQREYLGVDTVRVSSYGMCSETCLPWQGGIYIDNVYGSFDGEIYGDKGKSKNGKWYMLLSVAVKAGLFHPNCRHTLTTYYEGRSGKSPVMDGEQIRKNYKLEQIQRSKERTIRKWKRLKESASDPVMQEAYNKKIRASQADLRAFIAENKDILRRDPWRELTYGIKDDSVKNRINKNDLEQFNRYSRALKELSPKSLDDFREIKYNNIKDWDTLKSQYRTVNQYKIDSGEFTAQQILDLDYNVLFEKRNNFTGNLRNSGNIAGAYINNKSDDLFLAHSQIDVSSDNGLVEYQGTNNIVLLSNKLKFNYKPVTSFNGELRINTHLDTEAKLFEYFSYGASTGDIKTITMLSERGMCDSCKSVMQQFIEKYPSVQVNVVSNKKVSGNVWKHRWRKKQ